MYEPYNFTYIDQNVCLVLNSTNSDGKLSQRWRTASVRTQTLGAIPVFKPLTSQCQGGFYSVVYATPESLLKNERWRRMLSSNLYQQKVCAIAVDEAHVIKQW